MILVLTLLVFLLPLSLSLRLFAKCRSFLQPCDCLLGLYFELYSDFHLSRIYGDVDLTAIIATAVSIDQSQRIFCHSNDTRTYISRLDFTYIVYLCRVYSVFLSILMTPSS